MWFHCCERVYLGMSTGKPMDPSAAEMLSTMEVKARMLPCSGDSATLSRSALRGRGRVSTIVGSALTHRLTGQRNTHPHCCSSAGTARECCSTRGCCSRCCSNWAHLRTTPVTMEMQKLLSVTVIILHGSSKRKGTTHTSYCPVEMNYISICN